jgi:uncharacterized membrane protein YozB (DUF420 family)
MSPIGSAQIVELDLLLQFAILIAMLVGWYLKSKRKYAKHGAIMSISLILHTILIIIVMVPSFQSMKGLFENPSSFFVLTVIVHSIIGSLVETLSIWLVGNWIVNAGKINLCLKRKKMMRVTMSLWTLELLLGIYIFITLYV